MAQVLIRNLPAQTLASYRHKAKLNGRSLEQELREALETTRPFTPEERAAASRFFRSRYKTVQPSLTLEEIRKGLK
jgi:plasmid stability protein